MLKIVTIQIYAVKTKEKTNQNFHFNCSHILQFYLMQDKKMTEIHYGTIEQIFECVCNICWGDLEILANKYDLIY